MSNITATAQSFFDACETGKAWAGCQQYCTPNATFSSQANPLLNITTLSAYCDWMRDVLTGLTDVRYEVKSFATDTTRQNVAALGCVLWHTSCRWTCVTHWQKDCYRLCLCHAIHQ